MRYRVWNVRRFMKENEVAILADGSLIFLDKETNSEYVKMDFLEVKVDYSTGLIDKNGKEIFESDICSQEYNVWNEEDGGDSGTHKGVVRIISSMGATLFKPYRQSDGDNSGNYQGYKKLCGKRSTILGNVYENAELLKA